MNVKWWKEYVRTYSNAHLKDILKAIKTTYKDLNKDWQTWIYKIHLKEKNRRASK